MLLKKLILALSVTLFVSSVAAECDTNQTHCRPVAIKNFTEFGVDKYTDWIWLTGYEPSGLHWNQFISLSLNKGLDVYKNNYSLYLESFLSDDDDDDDDDEDDANKKNFMRYPVGTTFVKENYISVKGKPGPLALITVMSKRDPGFDPSGGDWEYLQFDGLGKLIMRGSAKNKAISVTCAECHKNVAERDFVFSTMLSIPLK